MQGSIIDIFVISIWAYLYCGPLTDAKGIFSFMPNVSNKIASFGKYDAIQSWTPNYLQKAVLAWGYLCAECHAGFFMAIYFPLAKQYSLQGHFACIVLTIFLAHILTKVIK